MASLQATEMQHRQLQRRTRRSLRALPWLLAGALCTRSSVLGLGPVHCEDSDATGRDGLGFAWPGCMRRSELHGQRCNSRRAGLVEPRLGLAGSLESAPVRKVQAQAAAGSIAKPLGIGIVALGLISMLFLRVKTWFNTPKRPYGDGSVGDSYDAWTREGVLEHYWGEHIHMGSYTPMANQKGYRKSDNLIMAFLRATFLPLKDFKAAKIDFTNEMIEYSGAVAPKKVLDVGCGIGGSSRILAKTFPGAEVVGITLSPEQADRATALAKEAGLENVRFKVMNALEMTFPADTFDMVWACESGEHMPDKKKYVEEMVRVLAPAGKLVVATWCERDPIPPFTNDERNTLDFLYAEWSHPYFISLNRYKEHLLGTSSLATVEIADWTEQTLPSWRHSIWVGIWSPFFWLKIVLKRPLGFLGLLREAYTLERYHRSMRKGLMIYGMMRATKKPAAQDTEKKDAEETVEKDVAA